MLRRYKTSIETRLQSLPPWRTLLKRLVLIYIAYVGLYAANGAFMGCQASTIALTVFPVRQLVFMPRLIDYYEGMFSYLDDPGVADGVYTETTEHGETRHIVSDTTRGYYQTILDTAYAANCRTLDLMGWGSYLDLILRE